MFLFIYNQQVYIIDETKSITEVLLLKNVSIFCWKQVIFLKPVLH